MIMPPAPPGKANPKLLHLHISAPPGPLPVVEAVNWFQFAAAGFEFQLLMGNLDIREIAAAVESGNLQTRAIRPQITHAFMLSRQGFDQLKGAVDQMAGHLQMQENAEKGGK
jgi:hypothetical protein